MPPRRRRPSARKTLSERCVYVEGGGAPCGRPAFQGGDLCTEHIVVLAAEAARDEEARRAAMAIGVTIKGVGSVLDDRVDRYRVAEWPEDVRNIKLPSRLDLSLDFRFKPGTPWVPYKTVRELGAGTYGRVFQVGPVDGRSGHSKFAVKVFFDKRRRRFAPDEQGTLALDAVDKQEMALLNVPQNRWRTAMIPGHMLSGVVVMHTGMDVLDFSKQFAHQVDKKTFVKVALAVALAAAELQERLIAADLLYTDMRAENLMLIPTGNGTASLVFSDYGGICHIGKTQRCSAYYPPPELNAKERKGTILKPATPAAARAAARYMSGVTFFEMMVARNESLKPRDTRLYDVTIGRVNWSSDFGQRGALKYMQRLIQALDTPAARRVATWLSVAPSHRR